MIIFELHLLMSYSPVSANVTCGRGRTMVC